MMGLGLIDKLTNANFLTSLTMIRRSRIRIGSSWSVVRVALTVGSTRHDCFAVLCCINVLDSDYFMRGVTIGVLQEDTF